MAAVEKHPIRNGIIVLSAGTVIGGVILAAILSAAFRKFVVVWLSYFGSAIAFVWNAFVGDYATPGWLLLLMGILSLILILRAGKSFALKDTEPSYHNYVEDNLEGAKWRWRWGGESIYEIWCFCPECDGELVYKQSGYGQLHTEFLCENCKKLVFTSSSSLSDTLERIKREILRRIRTREAPIFHNSKT